MYAGGNLYASICGTDVAVYTHGPNTGHRVTVGGEFGHEMVSEVVQTGKNVRGIHVGDRVYPYPLRPYPVLEKRDH